MKPFMLWGVPEDIAKDAIGEADEVTARVLSFLGERIDKRRDTACWWAITHAGIIRRANKRRVALGKKPRAFLVRTSWMERAQAMCEANNARDARYTKACSEVNRRVAMLKVAEKQGWV